MNLDIMTLLSILPLILLPLFLLFSSARKSAGPRGALHTTTDGIGYYWIYIPRKDSAVKKLGIYMNESLPAFAFDRESAGRRMARMLGFAHTFRTDDQAFDEEVYITSDDPQFCSLVRNDYFLRQMIEDLLREDAKSIVKKGDRLILTLQDSKSFWQVPPEQAEDWATQLDKIRSHLSQIAGGGAQSNAYAKNANLLNKLTIAIMSLGILGLLYVLICKSIMVDIVQLWEMALLVACFIMLVYLALIHILLGRSSLGYNALCDFFKLGIFGSVMTCIGMLYLVDTLCDSSPTHAYHQKILDKHITRGRHSATYHITLEDWRTWGNGYDITVNYHFYNRANIGRNLTLYVHPGYLHFAWIERYELEAP